MVTTSHKGCWESQSVQRAVGCCPKEEMAQHLSGQMKGGRVGWPGAALGDRVMSSQEPTLPSSRGPWPLLLLWMQAPLLLSALDH